MTAAESRAAQGLPAELPAEILAAIAAILATAPLEVVRDAAA